jgi:two-component system sensor histidine kinase KdpD
MRVVSARSARNSQPRKPRATKRVGAELVLSICHEVGNLLAAARLSAHLLNHEVGGGEDDRSGGLEDISAQAGCLLAHVRPLLVNAAASRIPVAPANLLEAFQRALHDEPRDRARIEVELPAELPAVRVDPDALHHVLLTLARAARDSEREPSRSGRRIRVSSRRVGARVAFVIAGAARLRPAVVSRGAGATLRGTELAIEIAHALVERDGGTVTLRADAADAAGSEVRLSFPAVPGSARRRS